MEMNNFYEQILQLGQDWTVTSSKLNVIDQQVVIDVSYGSREYKCPECGKHAKLHDHTRVREWRHLDTCQMQTIIRCQIPRVRCGEHKVRTLQVPWAEPHGHFTLFFEAFCIQLLQATQNQTKVCKLLNISHDQLHHIKVRAVNRGMARREKEEIKVVGIDEKSMKRGHHYLSVLGDPKGNRVLEVVENRTQESAEFLIKTALNAEQRKGITCISMDMWKPFEKAAKELLPQADVVFDRFHVSQHLGMAVDTTRRQEMRKLLKEDQEKAKDLKNSRFLFLWNMDNIPEHRILSFQAARESAKKTTTVWGMKEVFRSFWDKPTIQSGREYLERWIEEALKEKIPALTKVAKMIQRNAQGILNYLMHKITNASVESLNGRIQQLKTNARGFRSFENYRINILFHLGGLNMLPLKTL